MIVIDNAIFIFPIVLMDSIKGCSNFHTLWRRSGVTTESNPRGADYNEK
jgi:hypothetical protein